ncbi:MAG: LamG domain-containing protein, partial [Planctomycetota bacterium]
MRTKQLICFASFVLVLSVVAGTPHVSSAQIIGPVVRGGSSTNDPPVIAPNPLGEDELCFVDRMHQYNDIPIDLLGAEYVMVANNDRTQADYSLEVTLNPVLCGCGTIKLYLFLDNRLGHHDIPGHDPLLNPDLLAAGMGWVYDMEFRDTGQNIGIDEAGNGVIDNWSSIYIMDTYYLMDLACNMALADGTITLLQQNDTTPGGRNMYGVAAVYSSDPYPCWPSPRNGAVDVPVDANLSWPRRDDVVEEKVYFGTDPCMANLPLVATIPALPPFPPLWNPPGDLVASTTYYWYVLETGGNMAQYIPVPDPPPWNFTTIRGEAQPEYPLDGDMIEGDVDSTSGNIWTKLIFIPGPTSVVYRGYFNEDYSKVASRHADADLGPPPYPSPPYTYWFFVGAPIPPATQSLVRGTKYYWTVDSNDALGNTFAGDVWEFYLQDFKAGCPNPPNEAVLISVTPLLSWCPGFGVDEYDIYIGTSWEDVNGPGYDPDLPYPVEFRGTTTEPYYQVVDPLPYNTKIYWRVDGVVGRGPPFFIPTDFYKGDVWCFTTIPCFCITEPNLVGLWKFDIGMGDTAYDWTGNGNNGTLMGDPQWVASMNTMLGVAMDFDGSGDYIYTGKSAADLRINGNHPRMVAAWVFTREFNNGAIWDVGAHSDSQDFCLRTLDTDNQWRIQYGGGAGHDFTYDSLNKWVHFALVFDPPSSSTCYANAAVISTVNDAFLNTSNANPFQIGCHGWQNDYFNGIIDDVRIYDYAWDPPEIPPWPPPYAWNPRPYNGQASVPLSVTLKWEPGKYAAQHDVYLGTDKNLVKNRDISVFKGRIGPSTYDPIVLETGRFYYWAIDEVNVAGPEPYLWEGDTWMFRTEGAAGGLLGLYYHWDGQLPNDPLGPDNAFQIFVMGRIDPKVYFNWGDGSPGPNVNVDDFG